MEMNKENNRIKEIAFKKIDWKGMLSSRLPDNCKLVIEILHKNKNRPIIGEKLFIESGQHCESVNVNLNNHGFHYRVYSMQRYKSDPQSEKEWCLGISWLYDAYLKNPQNIKDLKNKKLVSELVRCSDTSKLKELLYDEVLRRLDLIKSFKKD